MSVGADDEYSMYLVEKRLEERFCAAAAALNHVAEQRDWTTDKANERDFAFDLLTRKVECVEDVAERLFNVRVQLELRNVFWVADRVRQHRPHARLHEHFHAHCLHDDDAFREKVLSLTPTHSPFYDVSNERAPVYLRDDENVREDDHCVHVVATKWLQTHFHCNLRHLAHLIQPPATSHSSVLEP